MQINERIYNRQNDKEAMGKIQGYTNKRVHFEFSLIENCVFNIHAHANDITQWREALEQNAFVRFPHLKFTLFLYKKYISLFVLLNFSRSHKTSACEEQKATALDFVSCVHFLFIARYDVICDLLQ